MSRGVSDECRVERAEKKMKKKITFLTLCAMLFGLCLSAEAQQPKKVPRIGYLSERDPVDASTRLGAIREALRELGYVEGQNIASEYRYTDGKRDRAPELAAELVRVKVDIIVVTAGDTWIRAAKKATTTIPIVMANVADPVGAGLIASLARPGGNITGFSGLSNELNTKRLEILKDAVPSSPQLDFSGQREDLTSNRNRSGLRLWR